MKIQKEAFGETKEGQQIFLFTLENANHMQVKITNYGATITSIRVADKNGILGDVVLGFDHLEGYLSDFSNFGAIIGRVTNRIAKGRFTLDGKEYKLATNNGPNHLHGGIKGFSRVVWQAEKLEQDSLLLTYLSKDGEEGYPGNLTSRVKYSLSENNELKIEIEAQTDQATPVNLTSHCYFNLTSGADNILNHQLLLNADRYIAVDEHVVPTGEMPSVKGTGMDFTQSRAIGNRIKEVGGYDYTYVINKQGKDLGFVARAYEPVSGRQVEVYSTQPGMHFYTANHLDGTLTGKQGQVYQKHQGFTLETNHFPDAPNQASFPSIILRPDKTFHQTTVYKFS